MNERINRIQAGKWCFRKSRTGKGAKMIRFLYKSGVCLHQSNSSDPAVIRYFTASLPFRGLKLSLIWVKFEFGFKFPGFIKYELLFDLLSAQFCEAKWKAVTHHRSHDGLKIKGRNLVSGLGLGSSMLPEMGFHWRGSLARREGFLWREGGFRFMQEELGSTWANSAVIFGPAQVKDRPIRGQDSCCVTSSALAAFRAV